MEPSVPTGSIVLSRPESTYKVGNIVTFSENGKKKELVTHRIVELTRDNGEVVYKTKGDANEDPDAWLVNPKNVVGKVGFTVPYVGYVIDFAKKPQGFILFVIIPATIVVYEELKNLKNEMFNGFKKLKQKKGEKDIAAQNTNLKENDISKLSSILNNTMNHKIPSKGIPSYYLAILAPLLGVAFVVGFSFSHSFFSDQEISTQSTLGASDSFETPIPEIPTPTP